METMEQKNARNARVQRRYDELMVAGKHGHYETMFRVVREEVEQALATDSAKPAGESAERAAFEAWIAKDCGDLSTFGSGRNVHYRNSAVNNAWGGWLKRSRLADAPTPDCKGCPQNDACCVPPAAPEAGKPVALTVGAKWGRLYDTANAVVARIGHKGEIDSRADEVALLMDALHDLDGGQWMPGLHPSASRAVPACSECNGTGEIPCGWKGEGEIDMQPCPECVGAVDRGTPEQTSDLVARGMSWEDTVAMMREACAQAGIQWDGDKEPHAIAINVMQRLANAAHKAGFNLALGRTDMSAAQAAPSAADGAQAAGQDEIVGWRHSKTCTLHETEEEVPLADGDEWAEPLIVKPGFVPPTYEAAGQEDAS